MQNQRDTDDADASEQVMFSVLVSKSTRDFKGQSSSTKLDAIAIDGSSLEQWIVTLKEYCYPQCVREIVVSESEPLYRFAERSKPTVDELDKFVCLYDPHNSKYKSLNNLTTSNLQRWRGSCVIAYVHRYSLSMCNAKVWNAAYKALMAPARSNRAGAADTQTVFELVST